MLEAKTAESTARLAGALAGFGTNQLQIAGTISATLSTNVSAMIAGQTGALNVNATNVLSLTTSTNIALNDYTNDYHAAVLADGSLKVTQGALTNIYDSVTVYQAGPVTNYYAGQLTAMNVNATNLSSISTSTNINISSIGGVAVNTNNLTDANVTNLVSIQGNVGITNATETNVWINNTAASPAQVIPAQSTNLVGGFQGRVLITPHVDTATYATNECISTLNTLTNCVRVPSGSGFLHSLTIVDAANQKSAMTVLISGSPLTGTYTENAVPAPAQTDFALLEPPIKVETTDYHTFNTTNAIADIKVMHSYINLDGTRNLYFVPIVHEPSVPDYIATNDVTFIFNFGQD